MGFEAVLRDIMLKRGFSDIVYDDIRLVDPVSKKVLSYIKGSGGRAVNAEDKCHQYFGRSLACENCTSMRAIKMKEQVVKIDYAHPYVFIALAEPVEHEGSTYVIEILKNITNTGMVGIEGEEVMAINQLLEHRNRMMLTDTLTKIYRENFIDTRLPHDLYRVKAEGKTLSLIRVSIQNIKEINEEHGYPAGDFMLKEFAAALRGFCKSPEDWTARYTGSEMIAVLFHLDETKTSHTCARIYNRLKKIELPSDMGSLKAEFSIGLHIADGKSVNINDLIAAARKNEFHPFSRYKSREALSLARKALPGVTLSAREAEVAALLLAGKSNLEIAQALFISLSTVKKHLASLYAKAQVKTRGEFAAKMR